MEAYIIKLRLAHSESQWPRRLFDHAHGPAQASSRLKLYHSSMASWNWSHAAPSYLCQIRLPLRPEGA